MFKQLICFIFALFVMVPSVCYSNVEFDQVNKTALKRIDNYVFVVDMSGSMMMKNNLSKKKISLAKQAMFNITRNIPDDMNIKCSILTICPNFVLLDKETNKFNSLQAIKRIDENKEIFGRMTNINSGIEFLNKYLKNNKSRKTAVFLVSDGEYNRGGLPLVNIEKLYDSYNNIILYVIDLSTTDKGNMLFNNIVNLDIKSYSFDGMSFMDNEYSANVSRSTIFGFVPILNVYFDFDKYKFQDKHDALSIKSVYDVFRSEFLVDDVYIQGWTDYIGTDEYNLKLSRKRALNVNNVFSDVTIDTNDVGFTIEGCGKSYMFDNKTSEGRALNRRSSLFFF